MSNLSVDQIFGVIDDLIRQEEGYAEHHPPGSKRKNEAAVRIQAFLDIKEEVRAAVKLLGSRYDNKAKK